MEAKQYDAGVLRKTPDIREAIARKKQIKGWLRSKKIALIESLNPYWDDLSAKWYEQNL